MVLVKVGLPFETADCKDDCVVEIEGLQIAYTVASSVNVVICNRSSQKTDVNVALDTVGAWCVDGGFWVRF